MTIAMLIAGFVIAFIKGWKLALVILATLPVLGLAGIIYVGIIQNKDKKIAAAYATAGGKAEEAIAAIKTVKFLTGEGYEGRRFFELLEEVKKKTFKFAIWAGFGIGFIFMVMLASYSLGFWYGAKLINEKEPNLSGYYTTGDVLVVFFSVIMGGMNMSQITPCLQKFGEGQQAAARIYAVLDRKPVIVDNP